MSEPLKKPGQQPESYSPKDAPELMKALGQLGAEKIIDTVVIEGVEFTIIEKARTFYAGTYAIAPDMKSLPDDQVYNHDSGIIIKDEDAAEEAVKAIRGSATPERKLYLWIDYENDERPCAMLFGQETTSREQPEGIHVIEAEPTLLIKVRYTHASWALTKKLTGTCVHQYQMTELFGLIKHIFCEGEQAAYEYNGDNGSGNADAEVFYYDEIQYENGNKNVNGDKYVTVPVKRRSGATGGRAIGDENGVAAQPIAPRTRQEIDAAQEPSKQFRRLKFGWYNWLVLEERDGKALIVSEKILTYKKFHNTPGETTWAQCDLRRYLNDRFYKRFRKKDRARILQSNLPPYINPWYGTNDHKARLTQTKEKTAGSAKGTDDFIFLLSVEDVIKYFGDSGDLETRVGWYWDGKRDGFSIVFCDGFGQFLYDHYNTARIAKNRLGTTSGWYTRTPGCQMRFVVSVGDNGAMCFTGGGPNGKNGIRPAMWVKL